MITDLGMTFSLKQQNAHNKIISSTHTKKSDVGSVFSFDGYKFKLFIVTVCISNTS